MPNYLIRVQLPDRPGALGAVASRIGSVGGDVVSIDILQRDNGAVVDELGVGLAGDHLLDLLRDEILEVDGVSIEALRAVDGPLPDRHAELLDIATELFIQSSREALLDHLSDRVRRSLVADFAAIIDADTTRVTAGHGEVPPDDELRTMALWAVAPLSSPVGADEMAFEAGQEPGAEMHAGTYKRALAAGPLWDYPQDFVVDGEKSYKMCFSARVDRRTVSL